MAHALVEPAQTDAAQVVAGPGVGLGVGQEGGLQHEVSDRLGVGLGPAGSGVRLLPGLHAPAAQQPSPTPRAALGMQPMHSPAALVPYFQQALLLCQVRPKCLF